MQISIKEIARIIDGQIIGDKEIVVTGLSGIKEAKEGDLTFLSNPKYISLAEATKASVIITASNIKIEKKTVIQTSNPSLAFAKLASSLMEGQLTISRGVHPSAVIAEDASLEKNVAIGPHVVIESKAHIGEGSVIQAGTYIGHHTRIGKNCLIYPNTTVRERVTIGNNVIIHSGTVVGSDGFGFVEIDKTYLKIPQLGTVVIEDDVEIGANVTIDRARFDKTVIGRGTKIDNLVQIAHNVILGDNCILIAQSGVAGSSQLGKNVIVAGQAGIAGHLTVGEGAVVAAQSGVTKSIPAHMQVSGYPAKLHSKARRANAMAQMLPKIIEQIKERIERLEKKVDVT